MKLKQVDSSVAILVNPSIVWFLLYIHGHGHEPNQNNRIYRAIENFIYLCLFFSIKKFPSMEKE